MLKVKQILAWGSFVCVYYGMTFRTASFAIGMANGVETRCGLGRHALATTPEQLAGLLKVRRYFVA